MKVLRRSARAAPDGGFVLSSVLGLMSILAAIGLSLAHMARTERLIALHAVRQAEAVAYANGLARMLAYRVARTDWSDAETLDTKLGTWSCKFGDQLVNYEIVDAQGLVDLNYASKALLMRILRGIGEAEGRVEALADAIIDYRDADNRPAVGRAVGRFNASAATAFKDAPFETVSELQRVPGMNEDLYSRLSRLVTVQGQAVGVSMTTMSEEVRLALNKSSASVRTNGVLFEPEGTSATSLRTFRIIVTVKYSSDQSFTRLGVIERSRQSRLGYFLREWQHIDNSQRIEPDTARLGCDLNYNTIAQ